MAVLWLCCSTSMVGAEDEKKTWPTKTYSLGEVVVSAGSPGADTIPTLEITAADIEKRHATTLDNALELLPGVDVRRGGEGVPRINIRGFRSQHTILLLNGIPINSSFDGQFDPHLISTENISKIKVSYGSHSVLYGQGGLAGVINIITKQGTKELDVEASGEMDDHGNHYSKANFSGGNEKADFFVGVNNSESEGFRLSDDFTPTSLEDGGTRANSDDQRLSVFGNFGYQLNEEAQLGLTLLRSTGEFGTPPNTVSDIADPFYKAAKYDRTEDFENLSGQLSMSYDPKGILGFRGWVFSNRNRQETARYDDNTYSIIKKKNNYTNSDETSIKGGTFQTSMDLESFGETIFSFSGEKDEYTSDYKKVLVNNGPLVPYHYDWDLNIYSTALEYRLQLFSKFDIVAGYSHHWQTKDRGDDQDKGSYMLGTSLKLTDATTLRASYARKIRFPSIQQLYDPTAGSANLKPEESTNYEAGASQKLFSDMVLDLTVFQNNVEQYIEKDDSTSMYENNEEYEFKGFEAYIHKPFLQTGSIGLGYSYLHTKDKSPGTLKDELQYRPEHKFTMDLSYTWGFGLTAHADVMQIAGQYFYSDTFVKGKLKDYTIVNLKLEQDIYKNQFFIYLGVDNIFDENYSESYGLPQAGRTGYAGIRMNF